MIELILVGCVIFAFCTYIIDSKRRFKKKSIEFINDVFEGKSEVFTSELKESAKVSFHYSKPKNYIDDITFNDLSLDRVFDSINATLSFVREMTLYKRLRTIDRINTTKFEADIEIFEDEKNRIKLMMVFNKLGKRDSYGYESIFDKLFIIDHLNKSLFTIMRAFAFISPLLLFVSIELGIAATVFTIIINLLLNERFTSKINAYIPLAGDKLEVIKSAIEVTRISDIGFEDEVGRIAFNLPVFKHLKGLLSFAIPNSNKFDLNGFGYITQLLSSYLLIVPLAYNKVSKTFNDNQDQFEQILNDLGYIDSVFAIASYRNSVKTWSVPDFNEEKKITFEGLVHPLLNHSGVTNDLSLGSSTLITGSNASGKSTFVRAIAINSIFAQSFNMVCAKKMCLPHLSVMTSMSLVDDIESGDSYFVTETKSLKRIIDNLNPEIITLICIDEILKGTNTIERVAASASLLNFLKEENCIVIAATHDLELTQILQSSYRNYHFSEMVGDSGVKFDYKVKEGVSNKTNAINLLESFGYDTNLVKQARAMVSDYMSTNTWNKLQ